VRWGKASGGSGAQWQSEPQAGITCLIERWDFSHPDRVFVRTAVTPVQPDRP